MKHRHLKMRLGTPSRQLPTAAVVDILERGDLDDWRPIAAAIARDPLGAFSDRVLELIDAYPIYGTSPLWRAWIHEQRTKAKGGLRPARATTLAALRKGMGLTQIKIARRMGMSQSDLSKLERRKDVRVSTLRAYARAMGGSLRVTFASEKKQAEIRLGR